MTVQDEINAIVADAKGYRWGPELYTRVQQVLPYADIFNTLRRELLPVEYEKFDLEYCEYIRPDQRDFITWLMKEQKARAERKEVRGYGTRRRLRPRFGRLSQIQ